MQYLEAPKTVTRAAYQNFQYLDGIQENALKLSTRNKIKHYLPCLVAQKEAIPGLTCSAFVPLKNQARPQYYSVSTHRQDSHFNRWLPF